MHYLRYHYIFPTSVVTVCELAHTFNIFRPTITNYSMLPYVCD